MSAVRQKLKGWTDTSQQSFFDSRSWRRWTYDFQRRWDGTVSLIAGWRWSELFWTPKRGQLPQGKSLEGLLGDFAEHRESTTGPVADDMAGHATGVLGLFGFAPGDLNSIMFDRYPGLFVFLVAQAVTVTALVAAAFLVPAKTRKEWYFLKKTHKLIDEGFLQPFQGLKQALELVWTAVALYVADRICDVLGSEAGFTKNMVFKPTKPLKVTCKARTASELHLTWYTGYDVPISNRQYQEGFGLRKERYVVESSPDGGKTWNALCDEPEEEVRSDLRNLDVEGHIIGRSKSAGKPAPTGHCQLIIDNLQANLACCFRVASANKEHGNSEWSEVAYGGTLQLPNGMNGCDGPLLEVTVDREVEIVEEQPVEEEVAESEEEDLLPDAKDKPVVAAGSDDAETQKVKNAVEAALKQVSTKTRAPHGTIRKEIQSRTVFRPAYVWGQTKDEITVQIPIAIAVKAKNVKVTLRVTTLKVEAEFPGNPVGPIAIVHGTLGGKCGNIEDMTWSFEAMSAGKEDSDTERLLVIQFAKAAAEKGSKWAYLIEEDQFRHPPSRRSVPPSKLDPNFVEFKIKNNWLLEQHQRACAARSAIDPAGDRPWERAWAEKAGGQDAAGLQGVLGAQAAMQGLLGGGGSGAAKPSANVPRPPPGHAMAA